MKKDIQIEPIGSYFQTDTDGFIVNPTSHEKIQEKWAPAVEDTITAYKDEFGDKLKNVYIRGSVAKGMAIEGVSDLDSFAYVHLEKENIPQEWSKKFREDFEIKYPHINGVDIMTKPVSIENKGQILLNQSLCVFGEKSKVEKIKIGRNLILHAPNLQVRFNMFYKFKENIIEEKIPEKCAWQMKGILRTGLELLIEKSGKYSRDLYPCYEVFSEYYPEKELEMRNVLRLALNPTDQVDEIEKVIIGIGTWLTEEIEIVLGIRQN
jgi:hypothetical protein